MKNEVFTKTLECKLTDKERLLCGTRADQATKDKHREENNLKSASAQIKSAIARYESIHDEEMEKMASGIEFRKVECEVTKAFDTNVVITRRLDTSEIIEQRAMRTDERQRELIGMGEDTDKETIEDQEDPKETPEPGAEEEAPECEICKDTGLYESVEDGKTEADLYYCTCPAGMEQKNIDSQQGELTQ